MSNGLELKVTCPELPKIPKIPNINIFGMLELKGMLDFSVGSPRDCTLSINLMLQIAPLLASISCLLKIIAVIQALEDTVKSGFTKTGDLLDKIGKVAECFLALTPFNIAITIKGILELIINFFLCFINQLESLISFQASIDLNSAEGNPTLKAALECAKNNGQTSMENLMLSLESIQPLLDMTASVGEVVGISIELPKMSEISTQKDHTLAIGNLKEAIQSLNDAIKSLPL